MSWPAVRILLGLMAATFALMLLALPILRISQRRLTVDDAAGLLIAGVGFGILAVAAFLATGQEAQRAVVMGAFIIVAGNIWQRRIARRRRGR
jgi:predicted tellurium resistance membrane protein TerC